MSKIDFAKVLNVPTPPTPDTVYFKQVGANIEMYVSDSSGTNVYSAVAPSNTTSSGGSVLPGTISTFVGNAAPDGWSVLDGTYLSIADNPVIYGIVGDTYINAPDITTIRSNAVNLVPPMTSANTPTGYNALASSFYGGGYEPFQAFDGILPASSSINAWITPTGVYTGWLSVKLPNPKVLTDYIIYSRGTTGSEPRDFTIEGTNDAGNTWTVIDTQTNQTSWTTGGSISYTIADSKLGNAFNQFIIRVSASTTADSYLAIAELVLIGSDLVTTAVPSGYFRLPPSTTTLPKYNGTVNCIKLG